jgi:soluble lytic murein transglycosylase
LQQLQLKPERIRSESPHVRPRWPLPILAAAFLLLAFSVAAVDDAGSGSPQLSAVLDPLNYSYPPALQATLDALGKAVGHFAGGRWQSALSTLPDDSAIASTAVADYIMLYKAKTYLELEMRKEALDLFRALQSRYPDSPVVREAVLGAAAALLKLHDPVAARAALESAKIRENADVLYMRGQALEGEGKRSEAIQLYLRVYADYVDSNQSVLAERRLRALTPTFLTRTGNREFLLRRGENLIRAGKNLEARTLLLKLSATNPAGRQWEKACLLLGDADTNLQRLSEALRYLRRITDAAMASQAVYLEGVCYRGLRNEPAFLKARDRALKLYPESPYTEKLLYSVATYYDVNNEAGPALEAYQAIVRSFPKGEYCERALWKVALYSYVAKRYEEALNGFWQCLLANPRPSAVGAAAYWMGRCCEQFGDQEKAAYLYRRVQALVNNSYYGQRAEQALLAIRSPNLTSPSSPAGIDFEQVRRTLDGILPGPVAVPQPSGAAVQIIERARQLAAAGLLDLALSEFDNGFASQSSNDAALCYGMSRIYQGKGNYYGAISTLRRVFPDYGDRPFTSLPGEVWDILFPVRHFDLITQNATRNNLDPDLVLALIRQESAFNESARSRANARGLMQVLPATGRVLARNAGLARYTVTKLYHPDTNIALGTRHLASLLQRYGGKVELALAAYNAGDNRVDRWLQEFGNLDMAEFVERIPLSETRNYVKQVMSDRAHYQLRTVPNSRLSLSLRKE